jgi:16S rRNA (guanine527-N7)-methyltransferase
MSPPRPSEDLRSRLAPVLELLAVDPASLSAVRDPEEAWRIHVADALSGLELIGSPSRLADIGSGAGFPGLVLAAALPDTRVDMIESVARKSAFIERATAAAGLDNARVVSARAEDWAGRTEPHGGREAYQVTTARAVGRLATLAELASPLLVPRGRLVAWKGRRDREEEAEFERAAPRVAMAPREVRWVGPYAGSRHRHLHLLEKSGPTPGDLPRRAGMAKKRPFGARQGAA